VIHGVECDHLAFRTQEVDWQIWIAQGDRPYPCRYVITSKKVTGWPQYTVDLRAWKTGAEVASADFSFKAPLGAKQLEPGDLPDTDELPGIFRRQLEGANDHVQTLRNCFTGCHYRFFGPRSWRAPLGSSRVSASSPLLRPLLAAPSRQ